MSFISLTIINIIHKKAWTSYRRVLQINSQAHYIISSINLSVQGMEKTFMLHLVLHYKSQVSSENDHVVPLLYLLSFLDGRSIARELLMRVQRPAEKFRKCKKGTEGNGRLFLYPGEVRRA